MVLRFLVYVCICQGTTQNPVGFNILLVEIKIGISAGWILNHASTDCNFDLYLEDHHRYEV